MLRAQLDLLIAAQELLIKQLIIKFEDNKCQKTAKTLTLARIALQHLEQDWCNHPDSQKEDMQQLLGIMIESRATNRLLARYQTS